MGHESYERVEETQGSSNRSFGMVFAAVFTIIGLFPLLRTGRLHLWVFAVAAAFLIAALTFPAVLAPLNRLWTRFGLLLHRIVSPLILGIMFFLVVTPTGLLMRAMGKNPLRLEFDRSAATYWIPRQPPGPAPQSLRDQF